ncbi:hypothetical protein SLE2022_011520 [Rubroshorea leprosula]
MAFSPKLLPLLFVLLALSAQIHAREFFSKVSSFNTNVNANEQRPENQKTELPNKEEQQYVTKQQQDPTFLPQTQTQSGYGLYGHESGQYPPETTTTTATNNNNNKVTYAPYVTPIRSGTFENYPNNNNNANYENEQQQNLGGTRFAESGSYRTTATNDNGYYNNNGYNNNVEKQGMSDTRFMENGKYFYDLKNENNYYQNRQYQNSRVPSRNEYSNTRGAGYYGNNANSYNPMNEQRYENEEDFEEVFHP